MIRPPRDGAGSLHPAQDPARQPHKVRSLFADGVYTEGWGTFCERLMLDLGWGEPLDRLAHLKKQLENTARTIVDIRVHTRRMERDEVIRIVKRRRSRATSSPEHVGPLDHQRAPDHLLLAGLRPGHGALRGRQGGPGRRLRLKKFMDAMMAMGPVPVRHYREALLGE